MRYTPFCWKAGMQIRRIARKLSPPVQQPAPKIVRETATQTGRAPSARIIAPMKCQSFPLWLLRDVPAFLGAMLSFWALVIFAMTSARKAARLAEASPSIRDRFAVFLGLGEARLDYALWRQAYRRIGWHPRGVTLEVFPPSTDWSYTQKRLRDFAHAFRKMNEIVDLVCRPHMRTLRHQPTRARRPCFDGRAASPRCSP